MMVMMMVVEMMLVLLLMMRNMMIERGGQRVGKRIDRRMGARLQGGQGTIMVGDIRRGMQMSVHLDMHVGVGVRVVGGNLVVTWFGNAVEGGWMERGVDNRADEERVDGRGRVVVVGSGEARALARGRQRRQKNAFWVAGGRVLREAGGGMKGD